MRDRRPRLSHPSLAFHAPHRPGGHRRGPLPQHRQLTAHDAPCRRNPRPACAVQLALRNALRYFPERSAPTPRAGPRPRPEVAHPLSVARDASLHAELAPEFARELRDYGHIYMMRSGPRTPPRALGGSL